MQKFCLLVARCIQQNWISFKDLKLNKHVSLNGTVELYWFLEAICIRCQCMYGMRLVCNQHTWSVSDRQARKQDASFSLHLSTSELTDLLFEGHSVCLAKQSVAKWSPLWDGPLAFSTWHLCVVCVSVFESLLKPAFDTIVHPYVKCFPLPSAGHPLPVHDCANKTANAAATMPVSLIHSSSTPLKLDLQKML